MRINIWKTISLLLMMFIAVVGLALYVGKISLASPPEPISFETIEIKAPKGTLVVEVADTAAKQELGINNRPNLPQGQGMLFTYNYSEAQNNSVWMKNKKFSIDIVWLNADKVVTLIKADISPSTYQDTEAKLYSSAEPSPYVLELAAGEANRLGIIEGSKLAFQLSIEEDTTTPLTYDTTIITAPKGKITAEIADVDLKYTRGLGYRQNLPQGRGMLFPLKTPSEEDMWMKGMNFPIDIIWLDSDKNVTLVKPNLSPDSYGKTEAIAYYSAKPDTIYVLELPAGDAQRLGITVGSKLLFDIPK